VVSAFSVIALIAVTAQLSILVALHVLPTKYDPVRDAISDYGVGDYRRYFWAQLVAGALACVSVAVALTGLHPWLRSRRSLQPQLVWAGYSVTTPHGKVQKASWSRSAGWCSLVPSPVR